ncbi:nuclear transport factor 2 family protein [Mycobacterium sp.]|uniref:nuclear transport factor 2 family protein n=1 Tax=Mycobacterium sp. TaxID=1785 RepID=UPI003D6ABED6
MPSLPPIVLDSSVDSADRTSAIDFINRVNLLFDAGDIDAMVEAFLPDSTTFHTQGITHGQTEMRRFFQQAQPYSGPGVSRIATNPIVDADDDGEGVVVRYHNLLVRYSAETPSSVVTGQVQETPEDLPAIWVYCAMTDRLRRHGSGWRIFERYIGTTTMNDRLRPPASGASYVDAYRRPSAAALPRQLVF